MVPVDRPFLMVFFNKSTSLSRLWTRTLWIGQILQSCKIVVQKYLYQFPRAWLLALRLDLAEYCIVRWVMDWNGWHYLYVIHPCSCNPLSIGAHVCLSMFVFPDSKVLELHPILAMRHDLTLFWASILALEEDSPAFMTNTRLCSGTHLCTVPPRPHDSFHEVGQFRILVVHTHCIYKFMAEHVSRVLKLSLSS